MFETKKPVGFAGGTTLRLVLEHNVGRQHAIGRVRVSVTSDRPPVRAKVAPDEILAIVATPAEKRTPEQRLELTGHVLKFQIDEQIKALPTPSMVTRQSKQTPIMQ